MMQQNDKPSLCLIHGWGTSSDIWLPWLNTLNEVFDVHCIALPGLGGDEISTPSLTLEESLEQIAKQVPRNSFLLGWSLGGMMATLLSSIEKLKVQGLITIACNPSFVQKQDWLEAMPLELFQNFTGLLSKSPSKTLSRFFALQVQGGSCSKDILKQLKGIDAQVTHSHLSENLSFLMQDNRIALSTLDLPSLHFYGEHDQLVPVAVSKSVSQLNSKAKSTVVKEAGHVPFLSDGDWIAQEITTFCLEQGYK